MAKFVANLDLNQNQILNGQFESVASDPSSGNFEGRLIYNSTEKVIKVYTGTAWRKALHAISSSTTALTASESNGTVSLSIANADGSTAGLLSATNYTLLTGATSDNTASAIVKRDASGNFTAGTITATTVTGLSDPVNGSDAATKNYVDAARSGLDVKQSVRVATTENITLSGTQTIDGVSVSAGNRVLVKNQSTATQNGIYVVAAGSWSRATDADSDAEVTAGLFTFVEEGTSLANTGWVLATDNPITVGSTALSFNQFSGAGQITAGAALTKTGDTLDVAVDNTSIEVNSDALRIASGAAGSGLGYSNGVLSVSVAASGGLQISTDEVGIKLDSNSALSLSSNGLTVASSIAGTGLTWTNGVLSVNAVNLASGGSGGVTGTLPVGNGGTGATTLTSNGVLLGNGTSAVSATSAGSAYQVLRVGSGGGAPAFGSIALGESAAVSGQLGIANGGTGASSASGARTALVAPKYVTGYVPSGSTTATISHSLGTTDFTVEIYEVSTGGTVFCDVTRTDGNTLTLGFSTAPSSNQYRYVMMAIA